MLICLSRRMARIVGVLMVLVALVIGSPVFAGEDGDHCHDGFLFRLLAGGGYAGLYQEKTFTNDWEWTHIGGGGLHFAFGGSPVENFSLYLDTTLNFPQLIALGIGLGGYFPSNWYLDAAFGYSYMVNEYAAITLGKEWWVSRNWGVGIALRQTVAGHLPDFSGGVMLTTMLNFSATYN